MLWERVELVLNASTNVDPAIDVVSAFSIVNDQRCLDVSAVDCVAIPCSERWF